MARNTPIGPTATTVRVLSRCCISNEEQILNAQMELVNFKYLRYFYLSLPVQKLPLNLISLSLCQTPILYSLSMLSPGAV